MSIKLFIARHAWAGEFGDPNYPDDDLRPLTEEGKIRYQKFLSFLHKSEDIQPKVIFSSPLVRCAQTSEIFARSMATPAPIEYSEALAPAGDIAPLIRLGEDRGLDCLAWIGHNPDVGFIVAKFLGEDFPSHHFAKGSIACLHFEHAIGRGLGELVWFKNPKDSGH